MSHYCCAVFTNDPNDFDKLLAPYNEEDESLFKFMPADQADIEREMETWRKWNPGYPTFEEYAKAAGYCYENGVLGRRCNPNAKWDWYTIDGKDYLFDPIEDEFCDDTSFYKKSQIDFYKPYPDANEYYFKAMDFWNQYVCGGNDKYGDTFFTPEYYKQRYKTFAQYVKQTSRTIPYSFITPDGVWHAPGTMGWFAIDDSTSESMNEYVKEFDDFINNAPDCYVTFADLHI